MARKGGGCHGRRSLVLFSVSVLVLLTLAVGLASGACEDMDGVSPVCQPADCGIYCMKEVPAGNYDCQNREDYPDNAKCCDYMECNAGSNGVCQGSITVDELDHGNDGGECIYSKTEDTYDFVCPNGWTHVPTGDQACGAGEEYEGTFMRAMCCCAPTEDTCNGKPPDYKPEYRYGVWGAVSLDDMDTPWYAYINISRKGGLFFENSQGYNIEHDVREGAENFRGFIRYVKAWNDGRVECGFITDSGVEFSSDYCDENNRQNVQDRQTAINFSYIPECAIGGSEDDPKRYTVLMKVDRTYEDGRVAPHFLNLTVVPGVYTVIGVFDQLRVDIRHAIASRYEECRNSPQRCRPQPTEEAYYDYNIMYVLARSCDMPFVVNITNKCKNIRVEGEDTSTGYTEQVDAAGFTPCEWEIIDGGRYHDYPGVYIAVMNKSRHGANIGLMNYYVNSLNPRGSTHIVNPTDNPAFREENIQSALKWNLKSAGRIMGCRTDSDEFWSDKCGPGNFTCSMGAGLAYAYSQGFRADSMKNPLSSLCGYFEWEQPSLSKVPGQRADYFQFNDNDDEDEVFRKNVTYGVDPFNPLEADPYYTLEGERELYDDQAFDFEMGIPDRRYLVNESIESIATNISAQFVKDDSVEWKGIQYRYAYQLTCRPGASWSRKYFYIPYGPGSGDDVDWENGPWQGGTTYEYAFRSGQFLYKDYPKFAEWMVDGNWYDEKKVNNPIIYWDRMYWWLPRLTDYYTPAATDRYWFVSPKTPTEEFYAPWVEATRPAHSGVIGSTSEEPLYYHNPGGYMEPGDESGIRVDPFNEGEKRDLLSYYRQFNKRMLWANVFKVTPEFHNKEPEDRLCRPETEGTMGGLGVGKGDCDEDCDDDISDRCASGLVCSSDAPGMTDYCCPAGFETYVDEEHMCCRDSTGSSCSPCDSGRTPDGFLGRCMGDCDHDGSPGFKCDGDACSPGLHCDGTWLSADFCCPADATWDVTRECCMKCGVYEAKLYDSDYCYYKSQATEYRMNCTCGENEGGCSSDDQCAEELECVDNPYTSPGGETTGGYDSPKDNACCLEGAIWNGYTCIPTSITQDAPIYTRTGGNSPYNERGGGPIWFHFAAGGNLPNETEAGGTYSATEYCRDVLGWDVEECGSWGLLWSSEGDGNLDNFWNTEVCTKAWDYMRDQGSIWDEQKNLGYDRATWTIVKAEINARWPETWGANWCDIYSGYTYGSQGSEGYWCTNSEGCNCYPNKETLSEPGPWTVVWGRTSTPPTGHYYISPDDWGNPYWMCDASVDGDESGLPDSCGKTCRKLLIKNKDQYGLWPDMDGGYRENPVRAWFDYVIAENAGKGGAVGSMESGPNVLPTEMPWDFLHAGAQPLQHSVSDATTKFRILLRYTVQHEMMRIPLAEACKWEGCSARQFCNYYRWLLVCPWGTLGENFGCPSPCGECDLDYYCTQYTQVCLEYNEDGECVRTEWWCTGTWERYPQVIGQCTLWVWFKQCVRCWGSWKQWACEYPVSEEGDGIAMESIFDTSTVTARPYGDKMETSRPLGFEGSHVRIDVVGYVDYKWGDEGDKLDYRKYRVDGLLDISAKSVDDGKDLLGGFELLVPDTLKVSFVAKDYPPIHDLYMLDSTIPRVKIFVNPKMQDMIHIQRCDNPQTYNSYFHYVINPLKKYYYAAQGILNEQNSRAFFSAIGETYTWDVTLQCRKSSFFRDPMKQYVGVFRNFHEDEARYWDLVGFYPQRKDLTTVEYSLTGNKASESETFTSKKTAEEESQIGSSVFYDYGKEIYTFNFTTRSIASEDMEDSVMRLYSDFRHIEIHPFRMEGGGGLGCGMDHITEDVGSVHKDIYMRHPVELDIAGVDAGNTVTLSIGGTDMCTGGGMTDGRVNVKFNFPYTEYSGIYDIGQEITVEKRSRVVSLVAEYMGFGHQYQTSVKELEVEVKYKTILDYIFENSVVVLIAFLALMSYRFYSSRRLDLQEMWEEWKGKK